MTELAWVAAALLIAVGVAGTVLPALPGVPLIFAGVLLAAWLEDFQRISGWMIGVLALLTLVGVVVDYVAASMSAKRAGASRYGVVGAALGTIAGVFTGLWGLLFMPLIGAAVGEWIAHRDALRAGKVGVAAWLGLLAATVAKLTIAFAMIGIFVAALIL